MSDDSTKVGVGETVGGATGLGWAATSSPAITELPIVTEAAAGGEMVATGETVTALAGAGEAATAAGAGLVGAAFGAGYLLGTGLDDLTGGALSGEAEKGMEAIFGDPSHGTLTPTETPQGQSEEVNGHHGHWVQDSNTPDIDATFIPDE